MGVVVTGASGKVGRLIAERLAAAGARPRLLVRDPARAPVPSGAEVVAGDFTDPASIAAAIRPGDRVFMVAVHLGVEDRIAAHRTFVEAAARSRPGLVAYLSMVGASATSAFPHSWSHAATEDLLRASGLPWCFLRMNMFLDDLPLWFDPDGVCRGPAGDGRVALVSRRDTAAVAAAVLAGEGHEGAVHDVTGVEALTLAEIAARCSAIAGRELRYEPGTPEVYRASRIAMGRPPWDAAAGAGAYLAVAAGELAVTSDVVARIGGVAPETVGAWAAAHPGRFADTGNRAAHRDHR